MNIVITDDDKIVAVSLKTILEATGKISVTAVGSSGQEAIELYRVHKPDVMLMDIRMNGMTGLEAGEIILKEDSSAKILYLTTFSDDEYIVKALTIGAKGYILKQDFQGIAPALEAVMNGQSVFGDTVMGKLPQLMKNNKKGFDYEEHDINEKEKEIIELVAEGMSNKEIAQELFLSEGTVRNYLSLILEKLNLRDRTQLAVFYYNNIR
ncbi:MAG: response regulator transcription factor [Ruminococcus sp.]|nr:response regulator transcription factor [Ruminococcus sp.]